MSGRATATSFAGEAIGGRPSVSLNDPRSENRCAADERYSSVSPGAQEAVLLSSEDSMHARTDSFSSAGIIDSAVTDFVRDRRTTAQRVCVYSSVKHSVFDPF